MKEGLIAVRHGILRMHEFLGVNLVVRRKPVMTVRLHEQRKQHSHKPVGEWKDELAGSLKTGAQTGQLCCRNWPPNLASNQSVYDARNT